MSRLDPKHGCPVIGSGHGTEIVIVNENDRNWTRHRYILCFGAYGWTKLLAYANSLDDALDECIDWIADHAPGLLCDDAIAEEYNRLIAEYREAHPGLPDCEHDWTGEHQRAWDAICEEAEQDTTSGGNFGNRISSSEWGIVAEDPSRSDLMSIAGVA